ncbi:MAG: sensor domain-containing diguanylate cyclase [Nitrospirae bacterium]|jgi:two-component system, cell cycle response regulator|nr:sensor domain-containing diguanylate cyclase [Nitrospirota bacterium]
MEKQILIYEKDPDTVKFLRSFFKGKDDYSVNFIKDKNTLKKRLSLKTPDILIISSPDGLKSLNLKSSEVKCPIIATISGKVTKGVRSAVDSDVEYYLLSPFHRDELDHKLKLIINKKDWIENLYMEKKDLKALIELTYFISSTLKPKEVLYLVVKKLSKILKVTRCSIISISISNQRYANVVSTFEDPSITGVKLDLRKYPEIRKAMANKEPVVIKDALRDPLMTEIRDIIAPLGIRSIVVVPVIFHDEVIGTLFLRTSRAGHTFTKREVTLCIAFAKASANALYNAFLYEKLNREKTKLEKLAITDYLTGIYNIRYFYNRLDEEYSRAVRYNLSLCCMMLDIDHFKNINDTYGHRTGDIVLREFAQLVKRRIRKSDVLARYGGEEFILLLPQTSLDGAIIKAERLGAIVREHKFKAFKGNFKITVSIGIACSADSNINTSDDLINWADNAMFKAKNNGRDQIVINSSL